MSHRIRFFLCFSAVFSILALLSPQPAGAFAPKRQDGAKGAIEYGQASWYGADQGCHTASGEHFDPDAMTAAHRHLPFGTIVRVTNRQNGRSVELRINDRGPWTGGRVIDVTSAAADILQMKRAGVVPVEIDIVRLGSPKRTALAQDSTP
jgi:rare lipoprotein A